VSPRRTALSILLTLTLSVTEGIGLLLLVPLLQLVGIDEHAGSLGSMAVAVRDIFAAAGLPLTLVTALAAYLAVAVAQSLLQRRQTMLAAAIQEDLVLSLRDRLYRAIAGTNWVFFARHRVSDFAHTLTDEVDRAGNAVYHLIELATSLTISIA
jgi:ATP-binding cassette, subfamily C, bacterial